MKIAFERFRHSKNRVFFIIIYSLIKDDIFGRILGDFKIWSKMVDLPKIIAMSIRGIEPGKDGLKKSLMSMITMIER